MVVRNVRPVNERDSMPSERRVPAHEQGSAFRSQLGAPQILAAGRGKAATTVPSAMVTVLAKRFAAMRAPLSKGATSPAVIVRSLGK
jgi:hypothetical protein